MTSEKLYEIICDISEKHIREAKTYQKNNISVWLKLASIAACFLIVITAVISLPMLIRYDNISIPQSDKVPPPSTEIDPPTNSEEEVPDNIESELKYEKGYFYNIDKGIFSTYIGGKVITEDKIGDKLADVSVTAGWKDNKNEWSSTEKLRGEVYSITNISNDIAVALKFIDKGEAITTTHYYVIMNPCADLTVVEDYIIEPLTPNNPGDEMAVEIPE